MDSRRLVHALLAPFTLLGLALALATSACTAEDGACKDDFDCDASTVCRVSTGTCEPFVCDADEDCASGLTCGDNLCE